MSPIDRVLAALPDAKKNRNGWTAPCPAHDDNNPSLSISIGDHGLVLLHCHAGCTVESISAAMGIAVRDLFPPGSPHPPRSVSASLATKEKGAGFATSDDAVRAATSSVQRERGSDWSLARGYTYHDPDSSEVLRVLRFEPPGRGDKTFRPIHPADGRWYIGDPEGPLPLYRLPGLAAAAVVYVVEGEKAADAAASIGMVATTNAHGAKSAKGTDWSPLSSKSLFLFPDNDEPGRAWAVEVSKTLADLGATIRVVALPGLPEHGDIVEFIAAQRAGGLDDVAIRAEIERLAQTAAPYACPGEAPGGEADSHASNGSTALEVRWPVLATDALLGLAGDFVRMVLPHSESASVALIGQFLVEFGNCIGRSAHVVAEADRHHTNIYQILVGRTAKGRKGTSHGHVRRIFRLVDEGWSTGCEKHGLSSGEGLIWAVRDPIEKEEPIKEKGKVVGYQTVVADAGVADKRLLVYESEFAQCLRVLDREGNTLSPVVRNAWDTGDLSTLTKNSPARATGAHISIIGHITQDEALRYLDRTEAANGFGNRFLWLCVRRSKVLPEGGRLPEAELQEFAHRLRRAVEFGRTVSEVRRDDSARELWIKVYPELSEGRSGLLGAITARAEAQVMRLALLFALLDLSSVIRREHLLAGLALWAYAEDSAAYVFGASLGDPVADEILRAVRASTDGLTRTQIRDLFGRNRGKDDIGRALGVLLTQGLARFEEREKEGPGRRAEVWFAVEGRQPGSGNRSWRSYLSYPRSTEGGPADRADSPGTATTKTTESNPRGEPAPEPQATDQARAATQATTQTTDTTESDQAEPAAPGSPTTETTSTTEPLASAPAGHESPAGPDSQEEFEWSA